MKKWSIFVLCFLLLCAPDYGQAEGYGQQKLSLKEVPFFQGDIDKGLLPSLEERLPSQPKIVVFKDGKSNGQYGGDLETLMPRVKDIRVLYTYGYARLIAYNQSFSMEADILKKYEVIDGREFVFYLRKGHKWSDGHPFTAEDFRYYWEDVANNKELYPSGPPTQMLVDGELPEFNVINETTVSYKWSKPNAVFLDAVAGASPLLIYRPAHYMKNFHVQYADDKVLQEKVTESGQRNWAALHNRKDNLNRFDNPDLPTLQPWFNTTALPSDRFVFKRNPFYHRIDNEGRQLPYINQIFVTIADKKLIAAKAAAGESDLQARALDFRDYTFLKKNEGDYAVYFWKSGVGSRLALYPNLHAEDPVWRNLMRNNRFREAISIGINRDEINNLLYYGLGQSGNNTLLPESPLFLEYCLTNCAHYDPEWSNEILDEIGLKWDEEKKWRKLPDGRRLEIIIDTSGHGTEETDILNLVADSWKQLGIKIHIKTSQKDVFRRRVFSGQAVMSVWRGVDNGFATATMPPGDFVPIHQDQLQWPKWGQYYETKGRAGEPIDLEPAKELLNLYKRWFEAFTLEERESIWQDIITIYSQEVYSIGTVSCIPQPILVNKRLNNVPKKGVYNWHPGAHFGIYRPETFWFSQEDK